MLSAILTGLGLLSKLLGLSTLAAQLFEKAQARRAGMQEQQNKDLTATNRVDQQAAAASGQVAGESDAQVRADLKKDFRP